MQAITVAIGPKGTAYFNNRWVLGVLKAALQKPTGVSDHSFFSAQIGTYADRKNLNVSLTNGSLSGFTPEVTSFAQQENGKFQLVFVGNNLTLHYDWSESYDYRWYVDPDTGQEDWEQRSAGPLSFDQPVPTLTCTVTVGFRFNPSPGAWEVDLVDPSPTAVSSGVSSLNLPPDSILVWSRNCLDPHIGEVETKAIAGLANNFSAEIQDHFPAVFASIPSSGQLTNNLKVEFGLGSSGLVFPNDNNGIEIGATGTTSWNATVYPGANPPTLALPPVPPDHHLNYYISDYSINALFWAFFSAGQLNIIATAANTPNNQFLNTTNYKGTPLQALYDKYPDAAMTANLNALAAPTVAIQQIYELSSTALDAIQPPLPDAVKKLLGNLVNQVYITEAAFFSAVVNNLGQADADKYKTDINAAARVVTAVVTHSNQVILNVVWQQTTIPVLTFNVAESDSLDAFVLGIAGPTQTLQFVPTLIPTLTTAQFVSSTIGIKSGDFGYVWNWVFQPVFVTVAQAVGRAGVALPRMQGFDFLFDSAMITLKQGYADVLTDVKHVDDHRTVVTPAQQPLPPTRPLPPLPSEWSFLHAAT